MGTEEVCNSWTVINLNNVVHNIEQVRRLLKKDVKIIGVVKGDAYGHGAIEIAETLINRCDVSMLAVANVWEGLQLRNANINVPILVLGGIPDNCIETAVQNDITIPLFEVGRAQVISSLAKKYDKKVKAHIAIDSGMRRIGVKPGVELQKIIDEAKLYSNVEVEGAYTHFAKTGVEDTSFTLEQLENFKKAVKQISENGITLKLVHCANSATVLDMPEAQFDAVRFGGLIYGYYVSRCLPQKIDLKPLLQWKSKITYIKELNPGESIGYNRTFFADKKIKVATCAFGFGDGYSNNLSNKGFLIIGGKKTPIIGKVCMDQCFADVSEVENVKIGDEVIIIGSDGDQKIDAFDIAAITGQEYNEVLSGISKRVLRIFKK